MVRGGDGFALCLPQDLGTALLCRADPEQGEIISANGENPEAEREVYGLTHPEFAARIFEVWRFSPEFTNAVARHHWRLTAREEPMTRCLIVGETIAAIAFEQLDEERSEEHTSELQSLMRSSYAVFCLKKKIKHITQD